MAKLLLAKKQQVSSEKCRQCLSDVKRNISSSAKRFLGYQQHVRGFVQKKKIELLSKAVA